MSATRPSCAEAEHDSVGLTDGKMVGGRRVAGLLRAVLKVLLDEVAVCPSTVHTELDNISPR